MSRRPAIDSGRSPSPSDPLARFGAVVHQRAECANLDVSMVLRASKTTAALVVAQLFIGCGGDTITLGNTRPVVEPQLDFVCESISVETQTRTAYLSLLFDVSGSMGQLDCPFWNHDPELKWQPVSEAIASFVESEQRAPTFAAMTLFPGPSESCEAASYIEPDVPFVALPSPQFRESMTAYEEEVGLSEYTDPMPYEGGNWRGGTPMAPAMSGALAQLGPILFDEPDAQPAIVLVTDGVPLGCESVEQDLQDAIDLATQALETGIPTYVIGVREPELQGDEIAPWEADGERVWACISPNDNWIWDYDDTTMPRPAPDTLQDLDRIAQAGGTGSAIILDTGNPEATRNALREALENVRLVTPSCFVELQQPAPSSDPHRLRLQRIDDDSNTDIAFDSECSGAGWRFSSATADEVELCPELCAQLGEVESPSVSVEFLCTEEEFAADG